MPRTPLFIYFHYTHQLKREPQNKNHHFDEFVWLHTGLILGVTSTAMGTWVPLHHAHHHHHHHHPASLGTTPSSVKRDGAGIE